MTAFSADFSPAFGRSTPTGIPTLAQVRAWIGVPATALDDAQLQQVMDAELSLQFQICVIPDAYPAELAQALYFRVAYEVQQRNAPLNGPILDEFGNLPSADLLRQAWRRLEGPWLEMVTA